MTNKIDCFIAYENETSTRRTIASLKQNETIGQIYLFSSTQSEDEWEGYPILHVENYNSTDTLIQLAEKANAPYLMLYAKVSPLELGYKALKRMCDSFTESTAMVYANYFESKNGETLKHPVNNYQPGCVRDDFDFGSVLVFSTPHFKHAVHYLEQQDSYQFAGLYALRLHLSTQGHITHINEYLYTEIEEDLRLSGEKQFDYVNPRNRNVQIEMECAFTKYLKDIDAFLLPTTREVDFKQAHFDREASVIIPVKNRVRTIKDAIRSVLAQETSFPFNLIVVDNHSTDGTTEAIQSYLNDERVVHLKPERTDLGIGGCWDMAINHPACGRFAVQLDSDDIYSGPQTLQKIVDGFYEQGCAMLIGSYRITDFNLNTLPPGLIDHKEWTDENGHNNALRINGLGAPRAFFTPLLREIGVPNVSYGEDYALGLAFSRNYKIGRIYEELYLCRRWEGNSDASLSIDRINLNNEFKDSLRTHEIRVRQEMSAKATRQMKEERASFIAHEISCWELAHQNHQALHEVQTKYFHVEGVPFQVQFNPARIRSTVAKIDKKSLESRPCFLCRKNQGVEQSALDVGRNFHLSVNPYPILPLHVTLPHHLHQPQQLDKDSWNDLKFLIDSLPEQYTVFYNGAFSGASAPDHFHYQGAPQQYVPLIAHYSTLKKQAKHLRYEGTDVYQINDYLCPLFAIETPLNSAHFDLLSFLKHFPKAENEAEPRLNLLAWREGSRYILVIIPRGKHRPSCYSAEGGKQMLVSPGLLDMAGILVTARPEDFEKITAEDIRQIIGEVGLSKQQAEEIATNFQSLKEEQ